MEDKFFSRKNIATNLAVYGLGHGLIDAICAGVLFTIFKFQILGFHGFFYLAVLYNVLAFGLQSVFGLVVDYYKAPRFAAITGCVLTVISLLIYYNFPIAGVILAGIGNALYHIGGGAVSLNLTPGKASAPGIFVAPRAVGLLVGTILGKSGSFITWPFIFCLIAVSFLIIYIKKPEINYLKAGRRETGPNYFELILILVLLSIGVRSLVGSVLIFPWKTNVNLLVLLTVAVFLGKGSGGILADKFGWIKVAVGALLLSVPLLAFGSAYPFLAIVGMLLFNITMPITLVALSNILPGRPAFAFGLTCLALLFGTVPIYLGYKSVLNNSIIIFAIIIISALALYGGLRALLRKEKLSYN